MDGSLVRTLTSDNVELQGLHFRGKGKAERSVIIHLHGTWGNFYGNKFIDYFATEYPKKGYSFITVNTRGHDDGSIAERFEDAAVDIDTWLGYLQHQGYDQIIIQGHSLGALKAVYYLANSKSAKVSRLILLSPFDVVAFYCSGKAETREERISRVSEIAAKDPNALVPKDVWNLWLISAGTYLNLISRSTSADIFPFRKGTLENSKLSEIKQSVLAVVGGEDFAAYPNPIDEYKQLSSLRNVRAILVPGAPHNFAAKEGELLREITAWLGQS